MLDRFEVIAKTMKTVSQKVLGRKEKKTGKKKL